LDTVPRETSSFISLHLRSLRVTNRANGLATESRRTVGCVFHVKHHKTGTCFWTAPFHVEHKRKRIDRMSAHVFVGSFHVERSSARVRVSNLKKEGRIA